MKTKPTFKDLFRQATGEAKGPFPYQEKLAIDAELPKLIDVPTGLGKTAAAVLAWLWRRRFADEKIRADTPRRLVYCLPMRVLVEQTYSETIWWLDQLGMLAGAATWDKRAAKPKLLSYTPAPETVLAADGWASQHGETGPPIAVHLLMGGEESTDWALWPERDAILIGTQDMLLSRALNRGYAEYPARWPVDFGLLNVDCLWVMDEVQLMGTGRTTSVQLQIFSDLSAKPEFGRRQTLWMSATLGVTGGTSKTPMWMETPEWKAKCGAKQPNVLSFGVEDVRRSAVAKARWTAPKRLELHIQPSQDRILAGEMDHATWDVEDPRLADEVVSDVNGDTHRLVIVFFNQVQRACDFYWRLRDRLHTAAVAPELILLHSRFRSRDRKQIADQLLDPVPARGRLIISTQVLEAGVDIDADTIFSEICPWSGLVQRLGRLNRRGGKRNARAVVFEPPLNLDPRKEREKASDFERRVSDALRDQTAPYNAQDIERAREKVREIIERHRGCASPDVLAKLPVPIDIDGPILREFDIADVFDTDPDLSGGHTDASRWVRSADRDVDTYILWRLVKGGAALDEQPPPHRGELCGVSFDQARKVLANDSVWLLTLFTKPKRSVAWRRISGSEIRPGDTVMLDLTMPGHGFYSQEVGWLGGGSPFPGDRKLAAVKPTEFVDRWQAGSNHLVRAWVKLDANGDRQLIKEIDNHITGTGAKRKDPRSFVRRWIELQPHLDRCVQTVREIAGRTAPAFEERLTLAAAWHDIGKALERRSNATVNRPFQEMLRRAGHNSGNDPKPTVLYAKSNGSGGDMGEDAFRHEVASALAYLERPDADDLVAYLILAHHGKVRLMPTPWDEQGAQDSNGVRPGDIIPEEALRTVGIAAALSLDPGRFLPSSAGGGWQGRVARLLKELGPFSLAYLEALLRVGDWRASS
jgi:CRISPR-associated endonuclease/helicase Cas3